MFKNITLFSILTFLSFSCTFSQVKNYKYTTAKTVYDNVVSAYDISKTAPEFILKPNGFGKRQILMYYPGEKPKIIMDEQVYDLCSALGKDSTNALAALLGHELAHHYKEHNWCSSFSFLLGDTSTLVKEIRKADKTQKLNFETQADDNGIFYGYVAGYATGEVMPRLLETIYAYYKMPDKLPGYPSKTERMAIAQKRSEEVMKLASVFDAATFLFSLREYKKAAVCFDFLAEKFPSREILNNSGVCRLLNAMEYLDADSTPFMLPIEFDPNTRLKNTGERGPGMDDEEKEKIRNQLVQEAIVKFDLASERDKSYFNARINKGSCYIIQKNYAMAIGIADELIIGLPKGNTYDLSKVYTLKAVAEWMLNNKDNAVRDFEKAKDFNPDPLTNYNSDLHRYLKKNPLESFVYYVYNYFKETDKKSFESEKALNPLAENINGKNARDISPEINTKVIAIYSNPSASINVTSDKSSGRLLFNQDGSQCNFLYTRNGYGSKTAQGISVGGSKELVKERYGEPSYTLNLVKGQYYVYSKTRIVFFINSTGKVESWFLFYKS